MTRGFFYSLILHRVNRMKTSQININVTDCYTLILSTIDGDHGNFEGCLTVHLPHEIM